MSRVGHIEQRNAWLPAAQRPQQLFTHEHAHVVYIYIYYCIRKNTLYNRPTTENTTKTKQTRPPTRPPRTGRSWFEPLENGCGHISRASTHTARGLYTYTELIHGDQFHCTCSKQLESQLPFFYACACGTTSSRSSQNPSASSKTMCTPFGNSTCCSHRDTPLVCVWAQTH